MGPAHVAPFQPTRPRRGPHSSRAARGALHPDPPHGPHKQFLQLFYGCDRCRFLFKSQKCPGCPAGTNGPPARHSLLLGPVSLRSPTWNMRAAGLFAVKSAGQAVPGRGGAVMETSRGCRRLPAGQMICSSCTDFGLAVSYRGDIHSNIPASAFPQIFSRNLFITDYWTSVLRNSQFIYICNQ